jgi:hypothetical protein
MQRRTRMIIILLFAVATSLAIAYAVRLSLDSGNYFFHRPEARADWVYDLSSVVFVCSLMLAEGFVACLALVASRPQNLWGRCLIGLIVLGPWAVLSTMLVLHMPAYTLFHHLWVWLLVVSLTLVTLGSVARHLFLRFRKEPPNNSFKPKPLRGSA